jgi:Uma2 family endonuclease
MTTEDFFSWSETWSDGERYELVGGEPVRLRSEKVRHAQHKLAAVIALRTSLKAVALDCTAFSDGVGVRIDDRSVREPDALVHCGPFGGDVMFVSNPVVVVEVFSPSSVRNDTSRKLIDYFSVPSIQHYLILLGDEERVVHHHRTSIEGEIATRILGRGDLVDLSPPGFSVTVEALFDS